MGCSASNLNDEEAVQICQDRKNFIKQAIKQRNMFAYGHVAYLNSLKRVCKALLDHIEGEHHELLHFHATSSLGSARRLFTDAFSNPSISTNLKQYHAEKDTSLTINYSRSGANPSISIEEWPESSETVRVESYPVDDHTTDHLFSTNFPAMRSSFSFSDYHGSNHLPASPQPSENGFFWDPFSSVNNFRDPSESSHGPRILDDDTERLRKIREEEGIPELEEEDGENNKDIEVTHASNSKEGIDGDHSGEIKNSIPTEDISKVEKKPEKLENKRDLKPSTAKKNSAERAINPNHGATENRSSTQEPPGITVYLDRRPMSIGDVMRDVETQFISICNKAHDVAVKLEVTGASNPSNSIDVGMFNPSGLFRTPSSLSSSSTSLQSSSTRIDDYETSIVNDEESCTISESHKSTLHRLYLWEKKQFQEVKCGERVRIAYEKKCMLLRSQDVNGAEPSTVDRTRAAIRDLQTQLNVSINAIEYISIRIESVRDLELHPQLVELIKSLGRMWRSMAECHRIQKRSVEEGKHLFSSSAIPNGPPSQRPTRSAAVLEAALQDWGSCLSAWVHAQRSYARALAGWIRRCAPARPDSTGAPTPSPLLTPNRSRGGSFSPPLYSLCLRWVRLLDKVSEAAAVEGVEFFAAGVASVANAERKEEVAENAAPMAVDVGPKVICAGLAMAVGGLVEFAASSAAAYEDFVRSLEESGREGRGYR